MTYPPLKEYPDREGYESDDEDAAEDKRCSNCGSRSCFGCDDEEDPNLTGDDYDF